MTELPGRKTWTEGDSLLLSAWADKKMPAMDRVLAGDDDAFDEVVKDALESARAAMIRAARGCLTCGHIPTHAEERVIGTCVPGYHTYALVDADPLEPEPEDDEETITYPDVWDQMGDRVIVAACAAACVLIWVPFLIWWAVR